MTLVGAGVSCVHWGYDGLLSIVASWFISPVFSGIISAILFYATKKLVLQVKLHIDPHRS